MFGRLSAKFYPQAPLDRRALRTRTGCTQNRPIRLSLRPFHDDARVLPHSGLQAKVWQGYNLPRAFTVGLAGGRRQFYKLLRAVRGPTGIRQFPSLF